MSGARVGRPRLLETHGCEGGATEGYQRAGWRVTVVDIAPNRLKYNPADELVHGDAATYIRDHGHEYDAIHTSPPCQWYTRGNAPRRGTETKWERTIPAIREALKSTGKPYVIENVKDAAWDMLEAIALCGCMFDLTARDYTCTNPGAHPGVCDTEHGVDVYLQRPRMFETNWGLTAPRPCDHSSHEWVAGAYGGARRDKYEAKFIRRGGYVPPDKNLVRRLLNIEHEMTWEGLKECVPPAYTQWVGYQLADLLTSEMVV